MTRLLRHAGDGSRLGKVLSRVERELDHALEGLGNEDAGEVAQEENVTEAFPVGAVDLMGVTDCLGGGDLAGWWA